MQTTFTPSHRGGSGPPLVCLHGVTDTWRTWELVLPALEREHDVLAVTLAGHAGGPAIVGEPDEGTLPDAVERAMDEAGFETAHIAGNSLGGWVALQLAARGRARSVVALAPAGGWPAADASFGGTLEFFTTAQGLLRAAAPYADQIVSTLAGRRQATQYIATRYEHIPAELIAHQIVGAAGCAGLDLLIAFSVRAGWRLDAERIGCPVRVVWGADDRILHWPSAAARFREEWLAHADWVELEGVGHCPQLDVPLETSQLILGFASGERSADAGAGSAAAGD
ncbi:MAG TPA: alpha/beta fold hydrolase [Solirubrobacteraceae bacterium]|jgi:pimeloyl-ACP methyl ester carboxylesterase|nr:alpha/beta fold hydrolase [Solirubrobacteraceae bacterium]